jgi:hypothetical protein
MTVRNRGRDCILLSVRSRTHVRLVRRAELRFRRAVVASTSAHSPRPVRDLT